MRPRYTEHILSCVWCLQSSPVSVSIAIIHKLTRPLRRQLFDIVERHLILAIRQSDCGFETYGISLVRIVVGQTMSMYDFALRFFILVSNFESVSSLLSVVIFLESNYCS